LSKSSTIVLEFEKLVKKYYYSSLDH